MNTTEFFIADDHLRPIWRFFLSVVLLISALVLTGLTLELALRLQKTHPGLITIFFWQSLILLVLILGVFKLMTAVFDRRPLGSMGFAFHSRWWKELGHGLAVGAVMLLLTVLPEWGRGFAHFTFFVHPLLRAGALSFALFALAAANEEAMFRGYPFQRLVEAITPVGAIAVTSAFFGLAHLGNPHKTWISTVNTMLVGIPFAIAYLRTRALWMPLGMHFIWNFLMGFVLGLPVSGLNLPASVLTAGVHGPEVFTGGAYGPEGDVLATAVILIATAYVAFAKGIYTSEDMKALVGAAPQPPEPAITISTLPPEEGIKRE